MVGATASDMAHYATGKRALQFAAGSRALDSHAPAHGRMHAGGALPCGNLRMRDHQRATQQRLFTYQ